MNIVLIIGIIIAVSSRDLGIQAIGILIIGIAIFVIDSRSFRDE